jgi:hypothetical protein
MRGDKSQKQVYMQNREELVFKRLLAINIFKKMNIICITHRNSTCKNSKTTFCKDRKNQFNLRSLIIMGQILLSKKIIFQLRIGLRLLNQGSQLEISKEANTRNQLTNPGKREPRVITKTATLREVSKKCQ